MSDRLLAAYQRTEFRVRLPGGGYAALRIGAPPPSTLRGAIDRWPWAFVTAWNPASEAQPRERNRAAQRELLAALRRCADLREMRLGFGVGEGDPPWREASLFVVGPDVATMDALMRRFRQLAYVHGAGDAPARLRWLGA